MKPRMNEIDIAKGLAALLVILGHVAGDVVPFCGAVHIPVFFILSGYVFTRKNSEEAMPYGKWAAKRIKRLLIPYGIYTGILMVKYVAFALVKKSFSGGVLLNLVGGAAYGSYQLYKNVEPEDQIYGFIMGNGPLWFILAMVISSLLFYAVVHGICKDQYRRGVILGCIVVFLGAARGLLAFLPIYLPWTMEMGLVGAALMLVGLMLRESQLFEKMKDNPGDYFLLPLASFIAFVGFYRINGEVNMAVCYVGKSAALLVILGILAMVMIYALSVALDKIPVVSRGLCYVGRNSLIIVCLHTMFISIWAAVAEHAFSATVVASMGMNLVEFVIGLFGAILCNEFLQRVCKVPSRFL